MTKTGDRLSLNTAGTPAADLLRTVAEQCHLNLIIGDDISGNLTLHVEDCTPRTLLRLIVDMAGAAMDSRGGVTRIMSAKAYEDEFGKAYHEAHTRAVFTFDHAVAHDVVPSLGALKSPDGILVEDQRGNSILAFDTPARLDAMRAVVAVLDRPRETRAFPSTAVPPRVLADRLKNYLPPASWSEADPAGGRLLVTGTPQTLDEVARTITLLDHAEALETRAFPLAFAHPDSVLRLLHNLLSPDVGTILTDRRSHTLIVTDQPTRLDTIAARIHAIDQPLRQVLIETCFFQVSFDDEVKTGIDWTVLQQRLNGTAIHASFPILADVQNGLRISHDLASQSFQVVAQALETFGKTNLLSSPRVMVADGQEARIHVGSQVPYITTDTREGANGTLDRFEKVTIVSVGVQLDVKARIHGTDMVSLEIHAENSSVTGYVNGIPVVETSEFNSLLQLRTGHTLILGGLDKEGIEKQRQGIPLLTHIPLIKYFVSNTVHHRVRTELAVLITPTLLAANDSARMPPHGE